MKAPLSIEIVTCSDSRSAASDESGARARALLEAAGHAVLGPTVVPDDRAEIAAAIERSCGRGDRAAVVLTGGTGIAPRDVTIEAVRPLLDKELPGFGEAFRRLSWDQVGARSILSRALAGTRGSTLVVALPGSPRAVELALEALLLPMLPHAAALLRGETRHAPPAGEAPC